MPTAHHLAAPVLLAATLLTACGNKGDASSSTGSASAAATATAAAPASAASAAPRATASAAPAAGGACGFKGSWTGTYPPGPYPFSGQPFEFTFNGDGTGVTHSARADQEFAWKTEGNVFSIHGAKVERGGRFTCSKEEVGKYGYQFTPDCNGVTFKLAQDACKGRTKVMDGTSMKRK
jgi:hypothetical protein